jgi:hypothetical protein
MKKHGVICLTFHLQLNVFLALGTLYYRVKAQCYFFFVNINNIY